MNQVWALLKQLAKDSPEVFLIAFCFFIFLFKDNIKTFLQNKFPVLFAKKKVEVTKGVPAKLNIVTSYSRQAFVYYFDHSVQIFNLQDGVDALQEIVEHQRAKRRRLVFNLAETYTLIEHAKDAFLIVLRKLIAENNIDFLVVLPNPNALKEKHKNMKSLIRSIEAEIKTNPTEAVKVKIDGRFDNDKRITKPFKGEF